MWKEPEDITEEEFLDNFRKHTVLMLESGMIHKAQIKRNILDGDCPFYNGDYYLFVNNCGDAGYYLTPSETYYNQAKFWREAGRSDPHIRDRMIEIVKEANND